MNDKELSSTIKKVLEDLKKRDTLDKKEYDTMFRDFDGRKDKLGKKDTGLSRKRSKRVDGTTIKHGFVAPLPMYSTEETIKKGKEMTTDKGYDIIDAPLMQDLMNKKNGKFAEKFVEEKPEVESYKLKFGNIDIHIPDKRNFIWDGYVIDPEHLDAIQAIGNMVSNGEIVNVLALGDAGSGKTTFATVLADILGYNLYLHRCQLMRDVTEWWGKTGLQKSQTKFFPSELSRQMGNGETVLLWDEVTRVLPTTSNGLLSVLDDTRSVEFQDNDFATTLPVGDSTVIYATANIGDDFVGTFETDRAVFDRWQMFLNFKPMTETREVELVQRNSGLDKETSESIVTIIRRLRGEVENENNDVTLPFSLSIRKTLAVANLVKNGVSLKGALLLAIINGTSGEAKATLTDIINGKSSRF